jgi:hypothetical protein
MEIFLYLERWPKQKINTMGNRFQLHLRGHFSYCINIIRNFNRSDLSESSKVLTTKRFSEIRKQPRKR